MKKKLCVVCNSVMDADQVKLVHVRVGKEFTANAHPVCEDCRKGELKGKFKNAAPGAPVVNLVCRLPLRKDGKVAIKCQQCGLGNEHPATHDGYCGRRFEKGTFEVVNG